MKINFSLGKCKTRAGYSAKLPNPQRLDLKEIRHKFQIILETPILLVIKTEQGEVIVHGYGELLFKEGKDMDEMEKIAKEVYEAGLEEHLELSEKTKKDIEKARAEIKAGKFYTLDQVKRRLGL